MDHRSIWSQTLQKLKENPKSDYTTFYGIGGNTLGSSLGEIMLKIKLNDGSCMNHQDDESPEKGGTSNLTATAAASSDPSLTELNLDTIKLPCFNGELTERIEFKDLFVYLIHKNAKVPDVIKFHQLRSYLKGIAFDTMRG